MGSGLGRVTYRLDFALPFRTLAKGETENALTQDSLAIGVTRNERTTELGTYTLTA